MSPLDLKKELAHLYNPSGKAFALVEVPELPFLMVDGAGDPNTSPAYAAALGALYAVAYGIRFALKAQGFEYVVPPLEGLWWAPDMDAFTLSDKSAWLWTMMILQPEQVTEELVAQVRDEALRKKKQPEIAQVRLERYHEGLAAQVLYTGPWADEGPTIAAMHAYIAEQGCELTGKHHEIYLGDPRRTPPEKLKTIIRQPARRL
jgi:hypothetical protein